ENDILDLYLAHREAAVRLACRVMRVRDGEDVVQTIFEYLFRKRAYLRDVPTRAYIFQAVRNAAVRHFTSTWVRWTQSLTYAEIESVNAMLEPDEPDDEVAE